jgi:hypothetical protein
VLTVPHWTGQLNIACPHGGWCPKGRRVEDGIIPEHYCLQETPQRYSRQRTKWNVRDSDATIIVTLTGELTGGTLMTRQYAKQMGRPYVHVSPNKKWQERTKEFLDGFPIRILNVAGPRGSSAPGIEQFVHQILSHAMGVV